jgi:lysophospholipid acyltransferase
MEVINESMFQHANVKATIKAGRTVPAGRKRAAYTKMIMGLVFLGIFVVLGPTYNFTIALTPEFAKKSLIAR